MMWCPTKNTSYLWHIKHGARVGWILGSFSRGGVPVHHTNGVHQLVGTGAPEGLGFEPGKTPKFPNPFSFFGDPIGIQSSNPNH